MKKGIEIVVDGKVVFSEGRRTQNFLDRLIGLIGRKKINNDECLIIERCSSVHSFFMRCPICVVYLDKNNKILYAQKLPPWRIGKMIKNTSKVIECSTDMVEYFRSIKGRQVNILNERQPE